MGRRGPSPKPRELRVAEGNPSRRPLPVPVLVGERAVETPAPPADLPARVAGVWVELAGMLTEAGMLTVSDLPMFEGLCVAIARARQAREELAHEELTSLGAQSQRIVNPLVRVERDAWTMALRLGQEFGLTPSARARFGLTVVKGRSLEVDLADRLGKMAVPETVIVEAAAEPRRSRGKRVGAEE